MPIPSGKSKKKKGKTKRGHEPKQIVKKPAEPTMASLAEDEGAAGIDIEKLVQTEYMRLQRDYRVMENTRRTVTGAGNALSKQERLIGLLRAGGLDTGTDLYNADSSAWHIVDWKTEHTIISILEHITKAMRHRDYCLANILEMESNVDKITRLLITHRLKVQAVNGHSLTVPHAERRTRILENRLYWATTRYDTKFSANKGLREEIDRMLKLRGIFHQRHLTVKRKFDKIQAQMNELVYAASHLYDQRDELVTSITNTREKNDKDTRQHILEMRDFHRILHNDAKVRKSYKLKNKERLLLEDTHDRDARRNSALDREMDITLRSYASSLQKILTATKYETVESLMRHYKEIEQENFARFVAISDVNHEATIIRKEAGEMSTEIGACFVAYNGLQKSRSKESNYLLELLEKRYDELAQVTRHLEITEQNMDETLRIMDSFIKETGCADPALRLLGTAESRNLNPRTALLAMYSIENRGEELLLEKHQYGIRKAVEVSGVPMDRATITITKKTLVPTKSFGGPYVPDLIVLGGMDGEEEGEEDEEDHGGIVHVLSIHEFRIKVTWKMQMNRELQGRASKILPSHVEEHGNASIISATGTG